MDIKLKPGQALVITGPQGSGKTKLAHDLARGFGRYGVLPAKDLLSPFTAVRALEDRPDALVVEEATAEQLGSDDFKALISTPTIGFRRKGHGQELIKAQRFIFCMRDDEQWLRGVDDRRFKVVRLGACDRP